MNSNVGVYTPKNPITSKKDMLSRWIGAVVLFLVAYIHLALFFSMFPMNHFFGSLMLINGVGAFVAMIGVLVNARWVGWVLGIVMAGGAAVAKLAMNTIPGVGALLMGMPSGMKRPQSPAGHGGPGGNPGAHVGAHPGGGQMHSVLPMFTDIRTLATISITIELAFCVLAIYALVKSRRNLANR